MIPHSNNRNVVSKGSFEDTFNFGIKNKKGMAHIFGILRNQLYSDKILAVVREYSTNATDAHCEVGTPQTPIDVTVPTRLDPSFKVRDYGPGLSPEEVKFVYSMYGESSKRDTNDQVGHFGLGSKAAFAYSDSWTITSYYGGFKYLYSAHIGENELGTVSLFSKTKTTENNGIEICVPIRNSDIEAFYTACKYLYPFFKIKPRILGKSFEIGLPGNKQISGKGWAKYTNTDETCFSGSVVVMGGVPYPLFFNDYIEGCLSDNGISTRTWDTGSFCRLWCFDVPIGSVEISASREALQYTDKTNKYIVKMLIDCKKKLAKKLKKNINDCPDLRNALSTYQSLLKQYRGVFDKNTNIKNPFSSWKGTDVTSFATGFSLYDTDHSFIAVYYSKTSNNIWRRQKQAFTLHVSSSTGIIIKDTNSFTLKRLRAISEKHPEWDNVIMFEKHLDERPEGYTPGETALSFGNIVEKLSLDLLGYYYISNIEPKKIDRSLINKNIYAAHSKNVFKYNWGTHSIKSKNWDIVDFSDTSIFKDAMYVEMDKFCPFDYGGDKMDSRRFYRAAESVKKAFPDVTIIGIKTRFLNNHHDSLIKSGIIRSVPASYDGSIFYNSLWLVVKDFIKTELSSVHNELMMVAAAQDVEFNKYYSVLSVLLHKNGEQGVYNLSGLLSKYINRCTTINKNKEIINKAESTIIYNILYSCFGISKSYTKKHSSLELIKLLFVDNVVYKNYIKTFSSALKSIDYAYECLSYFNETNRCYYDTTKFLRSYLDTVDNLNSLIEASTTTDNGLAA